MKSVKPQLLDKQLIADSFRASGATYEDNAAVQKRISRQLVRILRDIDSIDYSRVLEIGCCTGILTDLLAGTGRIKTLYLNDIVEEFCSITAERIGGRVDLLNSLPGDIEQCLLPEELSLVVSSATLQWIVNLPALLQKIHGALAGGGYLVFSLFGPGTMQEISSLTGRTLHYYTAEDLRHMLTPHFQVMSLSGETHRLYFQSVREILQHIRLTGVGGLGRSKWLPGRFKEFERQYRSRYASGEGLPLSYASTFVVARKK